MSGKLAKSEENVNEEKFRMTAILLYIICFLDSLCLGLMIPFFPPYMLMIGGTHTLLGIFASLHALSLELSRLLASTCSENFGTKITLVTTLMLGSIGYLAMGTVASLTELVIIRLIFDSTNQTLDLCKAYNVTGPRRYSYNIKLCTFSAVGFIIGPAIGGSIFEGENGFYNLCLKASVMTAFSIVLTLFVPANSLKNNDANTKETSFINVLSYEIKSFFSNLQYIKWQSMNIVLIKLFLGMGLTTITIKFSLLLSTQYKFSSMYIGYTTSFQSFAIFIMSFLVPVIDRVYGDDYIKKLFHFLPLLAIFLSCLCYATNYIVYLVSYIPFCFTKSVISTAWKDMSNSKDENHLNLSKALEAVDVLVSIITPLLFGYACDLYGHYGVKAFAIVPVLVASYASTLSIRSAHYKKD